VFFAFAGVALALYSPQENSSLQPKTETVVETASVAPVDAPVDAPASGADTASAEAKEEIAVDAKEEEAPTAEVPVQVEAAKSEEAAAAEVPVKVEAVEVPVEAEAVEVPMEAAAVEVPVEAEAVEVPVEAAAVEVPEVEAAKSEEAVVETVVATPEILEPASEGSKLKLAGAEPQKETLKIPTPVVSQSTLSVSSKSTAETSVSATAELSAKSQAFNFEFAPMYQKAWEAESSEGITLCLQSDLSRMNRLEPLARSWQGPISWAVLVTNDDDKWKLDDYLKNAPDSVKKYISVHMCRAQESPKSYPINVMRNHAMRNVNTPWIYLMDMDESVSAKMSDHMHQVSLAEGSSSTTKPAYVVMSWQWTGGDMRDVPTNKEQLRKLKEQGLVGQKAPYNPKGYAAKDVSHGEWLNLSSPKATKFQDMYEPYYIARAAQVLDFDPRFVGYGSNYYVQCLELAASHFTFVVLPEVFNFADENPEARKWRAAMDEGKRNKAFNELGTMYGCGDGKCSVYSCVQNCPGLFE